MFVGWVKAARAFQSDRGVRPPQPTMGADGGLRRVSLVPEAETAGAALTHPATGRYALAGASRATGFSTIGRLTTADSTPNRIESHHTTSYDPVCS
jgi:hypothetical protein